MRQILGDALLEVAALAQGAFVQVAAGGIAVREGATVEEQDEQLQGVTAFVRAGLEQVVIVAGQAQRRRQVDFQKLVGHRTRPLPVQPPLGAVAENPPTQVASGQVVRTAQIAEHLRRGCQGFAAPPGGAVQGLQPTFGLHQRGADGVAGRSLRDPKGTVLCGLVGEQQAIRHVLAAGGA